MPCLRRPPPEGVRIDRRHVQRQRLLPHGLARRHLVEQPGEDGWVLRIGIVGRIVGFLVWFVGFRVVGLGIVGLWLVRLGFVRLRFWLVRFGFVRFWFVGLGIVGVEFVVVRKRIDRGVTLIASPRPPTGGGTPPSGKRGVRT